MAIDKTPKPTSPEFTRRNFLRAGAIVLGSFAVVAVGLAAYNFAPKPNEPYAERSMEYTTQPVWSQEFKDMTQTTIDTSVWRYDTAYEVPTYNDESQAYTDWADNVRIEPGTGLILEAHRRDYQYPEDPTAKQYEYTSGRIDTLNSFSFEYGKVEATMKLPQGDGVWPAFWLLSGNEVHTINEEYSEAERNSARHYMRNGELDIMEYYGNNPEVIESTVHTYAKSEATEIILPNATDDFHTYGIEVAPKSITWTLDGKPYHYFEKSSDNPEEWPFGAGNHMYVILNLAIGGPAGETQAEQSSWQFQVENVRFYEYTGDK